MIFEEFFAVLFRTRFGWKYLLSPQYRAISKRKGRMAAGMEFTGSVIGMTLTTGAIVLLFITLF